MKAMFESATYAVGPSLLNDLGLAEEQYAEFLDRLRQLSQRFAEGGVTFNPEDLSEAPARVEFQTPIGDIVMSKVHMLEENGVTIAAVFSDSGRRCPGNQPSSLGIATQLEKFVGSPSRP